MPIWTHKVLVIPFLPVGFCIWTVVLGLLTRRRWLVWLGAAVLTLSSLGVVANGILGQGGRRLSADDGGPVPAGGRHCGAGWLDAAGGAAGCAGVERIRRPI
ncbi:MAG: hypothetical protein QM757_04175 [Paludibaculum sp.]